MFLWDSIAFGPIHSRRLGNSLGINISPTKRKICSFNCLYCECGWTDTKEISPGDFLPVQTILEAVEAKLQDCRSQKVVVDSLTFSGNGEPTMHPEFGKIIEGVLLLRDEYYPDTIITCLSNSTQLYREEVRESLMKIENPVMKLDAGSEQVFQWIDQPTVPVTLEQIVEWLLLFQGRLVIQTLLLQGTFQGEEFDNSSGEEWKLLTEHIVKIKPRKVMLYTLDRETPSKSLIKLSREELEKAAQLLRDKEVKVDVYH